MTDGPIAPYALLQLTGGPPPPRLSLAIVSPGLPHGPGTLSTGSIGGSETAALLVARALARRGHHVTLLCPCGTPSVDDVGVQYLPIETAPQFLPASTLDAVIVSRTLDALSIPTHAHTAVKVLWCHDLSLKRQRAQLAGALWNVQAIYAPSKFHCDQIRQVHPMLATWPGVVQTRNGLDLAAFAGLERVARDPWKLVYGSRPERGLAQALDVMDRLRRRGLPWVLHVSSYDNTPPQLAGMYEALWARARAMPNVVLRGALTQAQWRESLASARALLYPHTPGDGFREIYALVVAEAQACGTPVVAAAKGAIPETLHPDAGILLGDDTTDVATDAYLDQFTDTVAGLTDEAAWTRMSAAGRAHGATLDWSGVAAQWDADIVARIAQRNDCVRRVRAHLRRVGEREAAEGM